MATQLCLQSLRVGAKVRKFKEHRGNWPFEWPLLVFQNVKDQAGQNEISNGDAITYNKLISDITLELSLKHVQNFSQNAIPELLDGHRLLVIRSEEGDLGGLIEDVIVGID